MNTTEEKKKAPLKIYCCAECAAVERKNTTPPTNGCMRSSFHRWVNLGVAGNKTFTCSHCKVTVSTVVKPSSYGCTKTTFHEWEQWLKR